MSQLLVVFGATGQQGGSVIATVLKDTELSKRYKMRGVTRDVSKAGAQALQQRGVGMVEADVNDKESLKKALQGADTVFAITTTVYDDRMKEREVEQGKAIADAAVAAGVRYIIFSTLSHVGKGSRGKYTRCGHFDAKAEVEDYIRGLRMQSAFFAPGSFMQNFDHMQKPRLVGDGVWAIFNFIKPDSPLPLIDTAGDTGKYVGAILAAPDAYAGKTLSAATALHSFQDIAAAASNATGKKVEYRQVPLSVYHGFLPPASADAIVEMFQYIEEYGYYGPDTPALVASTAKQAHGKLTTLDEYLVKCPMVFS